MHAMRGGKSPSVRHPTPAPARKPLAACHTSKLHTRMRAHACRGWPRAQRPERRTSFDVHGLEPDGLGCVAVRGLLQLKLVPIRGRGAHCGKGGSNGVRVMPLDAECGGFNVRDRMGRGGTRARVRPPAMCRALDVLRAVLQQDAGQVALEDVACVRAQPGGAFGVTGRGRRARQARGPSRAHMHPVASCVHAKHSTTHPRGWRHGRSASKSTPYSSRRRAACR